jgi:2-amino-4-hydroxy-6-hydroxymethyldihydropteridine diphosphokinase
MKAVISLGSNKGDRSKLLGKAVELISFIGEIATEGKVVETEPWGLEDQDKFLNQIIIINTNLQPHNLLDELLLIESKLGRVREIKWGPRVIDLDILFYEDMVIESERLQIPHPYLHEREFILGPLNELIPDFNHPKINKTVQELYQNITNSKEI